MATLAAGLPATALTGLDLHQLDSCKEFHCLITDPPFPRLSQREPKLAVVRPIGLSPRLLYTVVRSVLLNYAIRAGHDGVRHLAVFRLTTSSIVAGCSIGI